MSERGPQLSGCDSLFLSPSLCLDGFLPGEYASLHPMQSGRDCINESLKHKTACPSCKLFARKRDVTRDYKIDRVATLYAQLEAVSGHFVFCSPASRAVAPVAEAPLGGAAVEDAAFVVPSPPESDFETAREEFGEAGPGATGAPPALRLWAATPPDLGAGTQLTQDSAGGPHLSQPKLQVASPPPTAQLTNNMQGPRV